MVLYYVNFEVINVDLVGLSHAMHAAGLHIIMQVSVLFLYLFVGFVVGFASFR